MENRIYQLALTQLSGIGPILAKNAIAFAGSEKEVFELSYSQALKIPGFGKSAATTLLNFNDFDLIQKELESFNDSGIKPIYYLDNEFPYRLKQLPTCPLFIYVKGSPFLSPIRSVGVVGTRKMTPYGKQVVEDLILGLKHLDVTIFSGMAYGVDITAHKACLEHGVKTFGVLAHGLDRVYPPAHAQIAKEMLKHDGGLISEFLPGKMPDRENFPKRNRILAGLIDVLIVIESAEKGGSLITARITSELNREVMAVPGDVFHTYSKGCNQLIRKHKAHLYESIDDLLMLMNWDLGKSIGVQVPLFNSLNEREQEVYKIIKQHSIIELHQLVIESKRSTSYLAAVLLELELKNCIYSLPGMRYKCR